MIELGSFAFLRPWWLLALPALAIALRVTRQKHAGLGDWARAVDPHLLAAMLKRQGVAMSASKDRAIIWAVALTTLALSGPAIERGDAEQFRNLDAALIVLDVSNGAGLPQAVAAAQLLLARSGARQMGLLLYAGDAYLASPLTYDAAALNALLFAVDDHTVPDGGTRPDRALALARRVLRDAQIVDADVVLIGAGEGADPAAAHEATRLGAEGHSLHTLFVSGGFPDAPLRRIALSRLAAAGGGLAGEAAQPDDVAARISSRRDRAYGGERAPSAGLARLRPVRVDLRSSVSLVLFPRERVMRRLAAIVVVVLPCWALWLVGPPMIGEVLLALGHPDAAAALIDEPDRKGAALYLAGRWDEAAAAFGTNVPNAYNRGNALARAERYAEAIASYDQALATNPDDEDAAFNRALVASLIEARPAPANANAINANSTATRARDTHEEFAHGWRDRRFGRRFRGQSGRRLEAGRAGQQQGRKIRQGRAGVARIGTRTGDGVRPAIPTAPAVWEACKSTSPRRYATAIGAFSAGWRRARFSRRSNGCRPCRTIRADF